MHVGIDKGGHDGFASQIDPGRSRWRLDISPSSDGHDLAVLDQDRAVFYGC
jgi:hypothetical protein